MLSLLFQLLRLCRWLMGMLRIRTRMLVLQRLRLVMGMVVHRRILRLWLRLYRLRLGVRLPSLLYLRSCRGTATRAIDRAAPRRKGLQRPPLLYRHGLRTLPNPPIRTTQQSSHLFRLQPAQPSPSPSPSPAHLHPALRRHPAPALPKLPVPTTQSSNSPTSSPPA